MRPISIARAIGSRLYYALQKTTGIGFDRRFEDTLRAQVERLCSDEPPAASSKAPVKRLEDLRLDDEALFSIVRDDIYERFETDQLGHEKDAFGRSGRWIPRGCVTYVEHASGDYVKIFDEYYCRRGEGRYLPDALDKGLYDCLCPGLSYLVEDGAGNLRGYTIVAGVPISRYEFERFVGGVLRETICEATERTGLYFYDLEFHNVIRHGDQLSIIDLESVLPIEWFGEGRQFSIDHLSDVDIGWSIQSKWESPEWYRKFVRDLKARSAGS